jgi:pimeloyl-ACP methyl ester carboxylesterase
MTHVVFVHGLWIHASAWAPWEERFRAAGYETHSPGWPGEPATVEQAKARPELVAGKGINDVVAHYAEFIATLPEKPILVGHSFGGLIVQKLLGTGLGAAAVSIDAAPIKGVLNLPISALRVASVALRNPLNRSKSVTLTQKEFRFGFGNALSQTESDQLFESTIPSPGKPLFEAAAANFLPHSPAKVDVKNSSRGPLLLIAGGNDHTAPLSIQRAISKLYSNSSAVTELKEFPDRGHSLTIDSGWGEIADYAITWLAGKDL